MRQTWENSKKPTFGPILACLAQIWALEIFSLVLPLLDCFILNWSVNAVTGDSTGTWIFTITDTKLNVPLVTLTTQDNTNLLQQLKSRFKYRINWNKYQSKVSKQCQAGKRIFVLSIKHITDRTARTGYCSLKVEIKDYNIIIDGRNLFDQPLKNDVRTIKTFEKLLLVKEIITRLALY